MVLSLEELQAARPRFLATEFCGQIFGMTVHDDRQRLVIEEPAIEPEILAVIVERRRLFQIAQVLGEDRLAVLDEANDALSSPPIARASGAASKPGEVGWPLARSREPCAAPGLAVDEAHHRVVNPICDHAIVSERIVGDAGKALSGFVVVDDRRLLGQVSARHDERGIQFRSKRACSGVVGSMKPSVEPRRDRVRKKERPVRAHDDDWRPERRKLALVFCADATIPPDDRNVPSHQREGLSPTLFQASQPHDGVGIGRVTRQMIAAKPLMARIAPARISGPRSMSSAALSWGSADRPSATELPRVRTPDKRSARHGSADRRGPHIRGGTRCTTRRAPWSSPPDRRELR